MSTIHEYETFDDDEDVIELTGEESDEVKAAIEYADTHPDEWTDALGSLRRLRENS